LAVNSNRRLAKIIGEDVYDIWTILRWKVET